MIDIIIRNVAAELQRLRKAHGPMVQFVKLSLGDGRSVTIWADGRCTYLPPSADPASPPATPAE
jgi:hypothetical protein